MTQREFHRQYIQLGGGNLEPKIAEPIIAAMRGREPSILTPKRTEYGKSVRKDYENGKCKESRHTMQQLEPRNDGIANTLTTVQKDNLVIEPEFVCGSLQANCFKGDGSISSSLAEAMGTGGGQTPIIGLKNYRVRKLTPKECWRLMGFTDEDFDRAKTALNKTFYKGKDKSNSQMYKQAGNSIVINVLMAIFETMR